MIENAAYLFGLVGIIVFIGFLGALMFFRYKVPDILILIFIGLLLGPILMNFWNIELMPQEYLLRIAPFFAALALMIILFDGGLQLNFDKVLSQLGSTAALALTTFIVSMFSTAIITVTFLRLDVINALMLGAILGGTSGAIVIPLVQKMTVDEETRTILTLESVITDVLCVIVVISLIEIKITGGSNYGIALQKLASAFSIAIVVGLIFGIVWLKALKALSGKPYSFMITIAALFVLYALVELLNGSGAMAALIFGFVLSNRTEITRIFKMKTEFVFDEKIKQFQSELSFFVRTFFFVYLGLMFTMPSPSERQFHIFIFTSALIFAGLLLARYGCVWFTVMVYPKRKKDVDTLWIMLPRGLAAAVLATMLIALGIAGTEEFMNYAFMVILFTVCTATIGTFATERAKQNRKRRGISARKPKDVKGRKTEMTSPKVKGSSHTNPKR